MQAVASTLYQSSHHYIDGIHGERKGKLNAYYRQWCRHFPIRIPPFEPRTKLETLFADSKASYKVVEAQKQSANNWILDVTWTLARNISTLSRSGCVNKRGSSSRVLKHQIKVSLKDDRQAHTAMKGAALEHPWAMENYRMQHQLKGWYRDAEDRAPQPCCQAVEK